ncbi:MAG: 30S ribosomal protein S20, partial [Bacillota bacterium]
MANIKSAIKRAKLTAGRTARNRSIKSGVRTAVKKFEAAAGQDP